MPHWRRCLSCRCVFPTHSRGIVREDSGVDDTLPDPAYLDGVREALAELGPMLEPAEDGISIAATSLTPVTDGAWPELEVAWRLELPDHPDLAHVPRTGQVRLPYGQDWLDLSFYPQPADYAQLVKRELELTADRALRPTADHRGADAQLPDSEVADRWAEFLAELEDLGPSAREVRPGRVEVDVVTDDGRPGVLTFLITPEEWAHLRRRGHGEYGLGELLGAYDKDETFFRYAGAGFMRSVREELPPVRGTALLRKIAAIRARNPDAKFGWFAYAPDDDRDAGHDTEP
jgi:hypothetical protein